MSKRQSIRNSWKRIAKELHADTIDVRFFIAQPPTAQAFQESYLALNREAAAYNDIVVLPGPVSHNCLGQTHISSHLVIRKQQFVHHATNRTGGRVGSMQQAGPLISARNFSGIPSPGAHTWQGYLNLKPRSPLCEKVATLFDSPPMF